MKDCRDYFLETRRRVSFEYTLLGISASSLFLGDRLSPSSLALETCAKDVTSIFAFLAAGVNDSVRHAFELAELLHEWGRGHHVNLIPFNPIDGVEYKRPSKKSVMLHLISLIANLLLMGFVIYLPKYSI